MTKIKNHNYVIVCYDIGEKRVNKVFKVCKKYLPHYQLSIFKGPITPSNLILLKKELKKIIKPEEDCISIIKMQSESAFDEETLGVQKEENADNLII